MAVNLQTFPSTPTKWFANAEAVKKLHKNFKYITEAFCEFT